MDPLKRSGKEILVKKQKVQGKHICLRFCLITFDVFFLPNPYLQKVLGMVYFGFNHITTPYWDVDVEFQVFSKSQSCNSQTVKCFSSMFELLRFRLLE